MEHKINISVLKSNNNHNENTENGQLSITTKRSSGNNNSVDLQSIKRELEKVTAQSYVVPWKQKKKESKYKIPTLPEWIVTRPYMSGSFLTDSSRFTGMEKNPVQNLPLLTQERCLIESLLYVMIGFPGKYINIKKADTFTPIFEIDETIDGSLAAIVSRILPICKCYLNISKFTDQHLNFEYGLVYHAFCASLKNILKSYLLLVAQIENQFYSGQLTLQKFWFYINSAQPSLRTMTTIDYLINQLDAQIRGGKLIEFLHSQLGSLSGLQETQDLILNLLDASCVPFFTMLEDWITKGVIIDPHNEFFVEEHEELVKENINEDYNDTYWEKRYTLNTQNLPSFLSRLSERILITGKYLNVIRECGISISQREDPTKTFNENNNNNNEPYVHPTKLMGRFYYTRNEHEYQEKIENAYQYASKRLLQLLVKEQQLVARLRSLKHYFLLDQGDFFLHFMDIAAEELRKPVPEIRIARLHSLLELSLRTSTAEADPYKDDLSIELLPYNLVHQLLKILHVADGAIQINTTLVPPTPQVRSGGTAEVEGSPTYLTTVTMNTQAAPVGPTAVPLSKLTGLEAFTFDYQVRWPLSLILSRKALTKYQLVFRHLVLCKHVERQLGLSWSYFQSIKELDLRLAMAPCYGIRQRMMSFIQNLQYYTMFEVLEPNWQAMEENVRKATTIDEVLQYHNDFLDTCLKECMLTDTNLIKVLNSLMSLCVMFSSWTDRLIKGIREGLKSEEPKIQIKDKKAPSLLRAARVKVSTDLAKKFLGDKAFANTLSRFETHFNDNLKQLMDALLVLSTTEANQHMTNLILRLDFNNFYKSYFQKTTRPKKNPTEIQE